MSDGRESNDPASFMRAVGRLSATGVWQVDLATGAMTWSEEARRIHGVGGNVQPSVDTVIALYPSDSQRAIRDAFAPIPQNPESAEVVVRLDLAAESTRWVRIAATIEPAAGTVGRVYGVVQDVTEAHLTKQRLAEREEHYRALFEHSPDPYLIIQGGVFVDCNDEACRLLGARRSDIVGLPPDRISPAEQPDGQASDTKANQILAQLAEPGSPPTLTFEWVHRRIDGSDITVEVAAAHIPLDGKPALLVAWRDLTERRQAEAALRDSDDKLRYITENVGDVVWSLDPETLCFTYVSPSVERLRGFTPEEVMAQPMDAALAPEDAAFVRQLMARRVAQLLEGQSMPLRFDTEEVQQPRKDGSLVWTEAITSLRWNVRSGRPEFLGVTRDISARKASEEELRRLSITDPLTGLLNHRGFHQACEDLLRAHSDSLATLLFLDMDNLKHINDTWGHAAGDAAIRHMAAVLTDWSEPGDVLGRPGGDEFAVLTLRGGGGAELADEIRAALAASSTDAAWGEVVDCSIGATHWDGQTNFAEMMQTADRRMYRDKRKKRRRPRS